MKKYLSKLIRNHYKTIFRSLAESSTKIGSINSIEFILSRNTHLGGKKSIINLIPDEIITPFVLKYGSWEYEIINFIKKFVPKKKIIFIDIGANIGLISKQLIVSKVKVKKIYCFEPDEKNFNCLKKNLHGYKNVELFNYALGKRNITRKLYVNPYNSGDSTFITKRKNFTISIIKNINSFLKKKISKNSDPIIYKSDTQGMDEEIFLAINEEYRNKIKIAIIEISNFKYINQNQELFFNKIKKFKIFRDNKLNKITIEKIKSKIRNKEEFDLFMTR